MADRVAVVTGAGRGVGAAVARQLSVDDWVVVLVDLGTALDGEGYDPDRAQAVAGEIWEAGGSARPVCADVTSRSGLEFVLDTATSLGTPTALVHAAGILADQPLPEMTDEAWRSVTSVHLDAAFAASRALWPLLESAGGGSIVLLGSSAGFVGAPNQANYAAAKAGLLGLTRVLAQEGAPAGITANLVLPFADTRMGASRRAGGGAEDPDDAHDDAAGAGEARAADVAPLVSWLCSEAARGLTGQVLGIRGAELTVWSQPRPVSRIVATEGWHPRALAALLQPAQATQMVPLDTDAEVLDGPMIPVRNPSAVQGKVLPTQERRPPASFTAGAAPAGVPVLAGVPTGGFAPARGPVPAGGTPAAPADQGVAEIRLEPDAPGPPAPPADEPDELVADLQPIDLDDHDDHPMRSWPNWLTRRRR